jgi:O-antigen ligase
MVVFSPWAFGTARPWGIWTMNGCGYLLGLLLAAKWFTRLKHGCESERWETAAQRLLTLLLGRLTVAILGYCLIAGLNARSTYDPLAMDFTYHKHLFWLPHSYDSARTLKSFAELLAIACFFWAMRDWLLGKTAAEVRAARDSDTAPVKTTHFPGRLRFLLYVLCVNGALIGVEGIIQRVSGTPKPLWLLEMKINADAEAQFGPFAYRANAAQYFNLVWPVALGFWWTLSREARRRYPSRRDFRRYRAHWLLPCVAIMAACPVISTSRGGAFIAFACLAVAAFLTLAAMRHRHPAVKFGMLLFFGVALSLGLWFGWDQLSERLTNTESGYVERDAMYETARQIARDYPLFGVGPGAFEPVFQLYRSSPDEYWPAQLHNDWLETLVTFGWAGSTLIALAFVVVLARWFFRGNLQSGWRFPALTWLALAGCLAHARFDFPLQMYSILLLFVLLCSILFALSRRRNA